MCWRGENGGVRACLVLGSWCWVLYRTFVQFVSERCREASSLPCLACLPGPDCSVQIIQQVVMLHEVLQ